MVEPLYSASAAGRVRFARPTQLNLVFNSNVRESKLLATLAASIKAWIGEGRTGAKRKDREGVGVSYNLWIG
jgi:hypothetical protein